MTDLDSSGILDRLLAALGVGSARIAIELHGGEYARGSTVLGTIRLEGGRIPQRIHELTLKLTEFSRQQDRQSRVRGTVRVAGGLDVAPGEHREFPFAISVPDDARLTRESMSGRPLEGCRLESDAGIALAVNPRAVQDLRIVIHHEISAVFESIRELGFTDAPLVRANIPLFAHVTRRDRAFHPPDSLLDQIDGLTAELWIDGDVLAGNLVLHRSERSVGDMMKALVGANCQTFALTIPRSDLLTDGGQPRRGGARSHVEAILNEALAMPGDMSKRLLHPASAPDGADRLLRPAAPGAPADPSRLLRPSDPAEPGSR